MAKLTLTQDLIEAHSICLEAVEVWQGLTLPKRKQYHHQGKQQLGWRKGKNRAGFHYRVYSGKGATLAMAVELAHKTHKRWQEYLAS